MKLASIDAADAFNYARTHNLAILEFQIFEIGILDMADMITKCIREADAEGCHEFCIREVRHKYNLTDETHVWHVCVFGFVTTPK